MPLDSDIANADAQLRAEFFTYDKDGPWKGVPHIRIITPGDKTNIPELVATDYHKMRFQREWLHYQMATGETQIIGTPLSLWNQERPEEITQGQLEELFILKFQTVEQVALASDMQVARIGMGGQGLRDRARTYLSSKNAQASGAKLNAQEDRIAQLEAMILQLAAAKNSPGHQPPKQRRKPGRPPKVKVAANVELNDASAGATGR